MYIIISMTSAMAMFVTFLVMAVNKFSPKTDMFLSVLILIFMISAGVALLLPMLNVLKHISIQFKSGCP